MARLFSATSRPVPTTQPVTVGKTTFPVEVMEVMLSESHPEYKPNQEVTIGAIRGRSYDTEKGVPIEDLPWYNPIDPTDLKIPLVGEAVLLVEAPTQAILNNKISKSLYYTSVVGLFGAISNNAVPGLAAPLSMNSLVSFTGNMGAQEEAGVGDYAPQTFIPPLVAFEGDRIIQGRWGNAIRFGNTSNGSKDQTFWNNSTGDGDPITIISNGIDDQTGLMRTEDLNDGSSNLILSSTQEIGIEASNKLPTGYPKLNQYAGSQIILSSDKIVLNSMEDTVVISGMKGVSISTPEWKADITKLCDILEDLVSSVSDISLGTGFLGNTGAPIAPNPTATIIADLATITTKLNALKQ